MKRLIFLTALLASSQSHAEYNPFMSEKPAEVVMSQPSTAPQEVILQPIEVNPSDMLDKELKSLLNDISVRDEQDKNAPSDVSEYIATTNCTDIYYHTLEKRYEERKSKTCMQKQVKEKIIKEINKNEANQTKVMGK